MGWALGRGYSVIDSAQKYVTKIMLAEIKIILLVVISIPLPLHVMKYINVDKNYSAGHYLSGLQIKSLVLASQALTNVSKYLQM